MAQVHAVEDADDDEDRTELAGRAHRSLDDLHRAVSRSGRAAGRRRHEDLVGCEPAGCRGRDRDEAPVGRAAVAVGRTRQAGGRSHELAARDAVDLVGGQLDDGEGVQAGVERSQQRDEAGRPVAAAARITSSGVASSSANGPEAVRASAPR